MSRLTPAQLQAQGQVGFRNRAKPDVLPACRNCAHYVYDAEDRMGPAGETVSRGNQRCGKHHFPVAMNKVCDDHNFKHRDRRDA